MSAAELAGLQQSIQDSYSPGEDVSPADLARAAEALKRAQLKKGLTAGELNALLEALLKVCA